MLAPYLSHHDLYTVSGMSVRLGLAGLLTATFSACLWFITDGRLVEIFSGTSSYIPFTHYSQDILTQTTDLLLIK